MGTNMATNSTNYYYHTLPPNDETDPFKRLIAWKGLKIRSISLNGVSITIEAYRNRKVYFVVIDENEVKILNSKREVLDTVRIPKTYVNPIVSGGTTTTAYPIWKYDTQTTSSGNAIYSANTASSYTIDFE